MMKLALASLSILAVGLGPAVAETVTVRVGDSLSIIAGRSLGDARRWPELCELNTDLLGGNCDLLAPGIALTLPSDDAAVAVEPEVITAAEPVAEQPAEAVMAPVSFEELPPEGVTITATEETFDGRAVREGVLSNEAGAKRVRYLVQLSGQPELSVSWSSRYGDPDKSVFLIYSGKVGVIGQVKLTGEGADLVATSEGVVTAAKVTAGEGGWSTVNFTFDTLPELTTVQVLFYPFGTAEAPVDGTVTFEDTVPDIVGAP